MIFTFLPLTDTERRYLTERVGGDRVHVGEIGNLSLKEKEAFLQCTIAFGSVPADWIPEAKLLKWLQLDSVGFDSYRHLNWSQLQAIQVTNLHGFFSVPVAESVVAGILALGRGLNHLIPLKEYRLWKK